MLTNKEISIKYYVQLIVLLCFIKCLSTTSVTGDESSKALNPNKIWLTSLNNIRLVKYDGIQKVPRIGSIQLRQFYRPRRTRRSRTRFVLQRRSTTLTTTTERPSDLSGILAVLPSYISILLGSGVLGSTDLASSLQSLVNNTGYLTSITSIASSTVSTAVSETSSFSTAVPLPLATTLNIAEGNLPGSLSALISQLSVGTELTSITSIASSTVVVSTVAAETSSLQPSTAVPLPLPTTLNIAAGNLPGSLSALIGQLSVGPELVGAELTSGLVSQLSVGTDLDGVSSIQGSTENNSWSTQEVSTTTAKTTTTTEMTIQVPTSTESLNYQYYDSSEDAYYDYVSDIVKIK